MESRDIALSRATPRHGAPRRTTPRRVANNTGNAPPFCFRKWQATLAVYAELHENYASPEECTIELNGGECRTRWKRARNRQIYSEEERKENTVRVMRISLVTCIYCVYLSVPACTLVSLVINKKWLVCFRNFLWDTNRNCILRELIIAFNVI